MFKDREFDLDGLIEVLFHIGFTVIAIVIFILIIMAFAYHPVIMGVGCAGIIILAIVYSLLREMFNLIFPKKVDKEARMRELKTWLDDAKNAFEDEDDEDEEDEEFDD